MSKFFSFSQSEAKKFLENSKTAVRALGLKLVVERKKKPETLNPEPSAATPTPLNLEAPGHSIPVPAEPTHGKLLIVIPRRVAKANGRNLIRRRIKAIYAENQLFKNNKKHALFVYPEAKNWSYNQLVEFLKTNLKKAE